MDCTVHSQERNSDGPKGNYREFTLNHNSNARTCFYFSQSSEITLIPLRTVTLSNNGLPN